MAMPDEAAAALKWPTREARQAACAEFCAHLAAGFSVDSFPGADWTTLRYFTEQFPEDFPPGKLEEAARLGLLEWERIGKEGATGALSKFNASAWSLAMKRHAGWQDRPESGGAGLAGRLDKTGRVAAFKPRSSEEIALGVMALLTSKDLSSAEDLPKAKDIPKDGNRPRDID
ncbi:hypothetical protein [Roseibium sp.]|uniref:hypothetical protein n=1 Tax=Roseibium sp. TaxID=1936156 RepID=UPI003264FBD6